MSGFLFVKALFAHLLTSSLVESLPPSKGVNPCSTVSCYHNSMCVIDPSTDEPVCRCLLDECDGAPPFLVCADGITYKNPCQVRLQMCITQKWITVQHAGACGPQECSLIKPCPFYGVCDGGKCSCEKCDEVNKRRDFDVARSRRLSVCGSDGVTYPSKCHLRYQSCMSRINITVVKKSSCYRRSRIKKKEAAYSSANQLSIWLHASGANVSEVHDSPLEVDQSHGGPCPKYELRGCLPSTHSRAKFLGVYVLDPHKQQAGSPVYRKQTNSRSKQKNTYLSRYTSSRIKNGSWVVGSKVGTGIGWFASIDSSRDPAFITETWYSTAGHKKNPWQLEPKISGRCLVRSGPVDEQECNLGEEKGQLGMNWQSITQEIPLYQLRIRNRRGKEMTHYKPRENIIVDVVSNNRALRFTSLYVSFHNDVDECGLPELNKLRPKFVAVCGGKVLMRGGKKMKRAAMRLTAPPRGCITISAFVKSARGEIFYDTPSKESTAPTPLTGKLCHVGYNKPEKLTPDIQ